MRKSVQNDTPNSRKLLIGQSLFYARTYRSKYGRFLGGGNARSRFDFEPRDKVSVTNREQEATAKTTPLTRGGRGFTPGIWLGQLAKPTRRD